MFMSSRVLLKYFLWNNNRLKQLLKLLENLKINTVIKRKYTPAISLKMLMDRKHIRMLFCFLSIVAITLCTPIVVSALEPPAPEEIKQYERDKSLAERIEYARTLGNHLASKSFVKRSHYKLRKLFPRLKGDVLLEMSETLAPPPAWEGMPTTGNVKILALLIEFSDYPSSNSVSSINSKLFGSGSGGYPYESLHNYYDRSSYNQLNIVGNTLGWYTTPYPRNDVSPTKTGRENLIKEALSYYDSIGHDFAQYDNDGDGVIDYLVVIWTGPHTGWATFWWGYMTHFSDPSFTIDGKTLDVYSWQWEARTWPGTFSPQVVIHETGHALGLPDLYDYDESVGPNGGVGGLDMMDANRGDHNCFSKFVLGWLTPTTINSGSHTVSLNASGSSNDAASVMPGIASGDLFEEFFMVQNRFRVNNDINNPNDGFLIWHIDSRLDISGYDYLYNNSYTDHKLVRLMEADGLEQIEMNFLADTGDYYTAGDIFGPDTFPDSHRYDGTSTGINVEEISDSGSVMTAKISVFDPEASYKDLSYSSVEPCRIVDTRLAGGAIPPGGIRSYNVWGAVAFQGGNPVGCPSPSGEPRAVHVNVTAVPVADSGNILAFAFGSAAPNASMVNYRAGAQNVANSGTVKTCFNCVKDINIQSNYGTAHVVIDVLGYYFSNPYH